MGRTHLVDIYGDMIDQQLGQCSDNNGTCDHCQALGRCYKAICEIDGAVVSREDYRIWERKFRQIQAGKN